MTICMIILMNGIPVSVFLWFCLLSAIMILVSSSNVLIHYMMWKYI